MKSTSFFISKANELLDTINADIQRIEEAQKTPAPSADVEYVDLSWMQKVQISSFGRRGVLHDVFFQVKLLFSQAPGGDLFLEKLNSYPTPSPFDNDRAEFHKLVSELLSVFITYMSDYHTE